MIVPNPGVTPWTLWAQTLVGYNPELSTQVSSTLEWQEFADRMSLVVAQTPRGDFFDDWRSWAEALKLAVG